MQVVHGKVLEARRTIEEHMRDLKAACDSMEAAQQVRVPVILDVVLLLCICEMCAVCHTARTPRPSGSVWVHEVRVPRMMFQAEVKT